MNMKALAVLAHLARLARAAAGALQFVDRVGRPRGTLDVSVFRNGVLVDHWVEKNLVVDTSKTMLAPLLGGDVTNQSVTQIGFGTNGTAPVNGNTALTGAFVKAVDSHSYPSASSVSFAFSLASTDANGLAIMEFGLLSGGGTLFSRKVRNAALNKDTDITLTGTWVIQF